MNNGVNCSRIRNDWFGIGSWRRRALRAWRVLRSLFLFSRTSLLPSSDFGLPGIGFKPSFILSGRPPSAVRPRPSNVLVRGQLFSSRHSAAGGEGRAKKWSHVQCRIVQEVQFGCNLVLASLPSPSRLSLRRVDPEAERTSLFHRSANLTRKEREGEREDGPRVEFNDFLEFGRRDLGGVEEISRGILPSGTGVRSFCSWCSL